jgi:hypothetical protein
MSDQFQIMHLSSAHCSLLPLLALGHWTILKLYRMVINYLYTMDVMSSKLLLGTGLSPDLILLISNVSYYKPISDGGPLLFPPLRRLNI